MFQPLHIIINWPSFTTMKNCTSHCFVKYLSLIDKVLSLLEGHQLPQLHPHLLHSCDRVPSSAPPTSLTARQHSAAMHSSDSPINTFHPGLHCLVPITHIASQISYNIQTAHYSTTLVVHPVTTHTVQQLPLTLPAYTTPFLDTSTVHTFYIILPYPVLYTFIFCTNSTKCTPYSRMMPR